MASTRLPGKPLEEIGGIPMVVHTWRAATSHPDIDRVCVATDHPAIAEAVRKAGGEAIMTREDHASGTDRCLEAWIQWGGQGAVINLQGDEPFPDATHLSAICDGLLQGKWEVVSAMRPAQPGEAESMHRVKVAATEHGRALYFSRSPIPHGGPHWIHLGIYGFSPGALQRCAQLPPGALEAGENLEQLRWLEHGIDIGLVQVVEGRTPGSVDTTEDLNRMRAWYAIEHQGLKQSNG